MIDLKSELLKNIKTFVSSADKIYVDKDYTSSCVLYCKALFACLDYILLINGYGVPKDHSERFRSLEKHYPVLYSTLDKIFPIYQKTYSTSIDKDTCDFVSKYVKNIIERSKIPV